MFYEETGGGEPLILIMGFGGDHLAWAFQVRALAEHYRVVTFDNRGAGQSDAPELPYTIRTMADDTAGLIAALGIERAHVVGVSMGGMIAQELALAYPRRVRSLHLGCTTARPDTHMKALLATWRDMRAALTPDALVRALMLWLFSYRLPAIADGISRPGGGHRASRHAGAAPRHPLPDARERRRGRHPGPAPILAGAGGSHPGRRPPRRRRRRPRLLLGAGRRLQRALPGLPGGEDHSVSSVTV